MSKIDYKELAELDTGCLVLLFYSRLICSIYGPTFPASIFPKRFINAFFPMIDLFLSDDVASNSFGLILEKFKKSMSYNRVFPECSDDLAFAIDEIDVEMLEKKIFDVACRRLGLKTIGFGLKLPHTDPLYESFKRHFNWARKKDISKMNDIAIAFSSADAEFADRTGLKQALASSIGLLFGMKPRLAKISENTNGILFGSDCIKPTLDIPVWIVSVTSECSVEDQLSFIRERDEKCLVVIVPLGDVNAVCRSLPVNLIHHYYLVVSDRDVVGFFYGLNGNSDFKSTLLRALPLIVVSPYRFNGEAGETFVGRREETQKIISSKTTHYCILGPRKAGKTSLLSELKRRVNADSSGWSVAIHLDAQNSKKITHFQRELYDAFFAATQHKIPLSTLEPGADFFSSFSNQLLTVREKGFKVTFLIDEIDKILFSEGADVEDFLRSAGNRNLARFIVFGYTVLNRRVNDHSTAIYNLFEKITLGPLDLPAALELTSQPMKELGVNYEDDGIPKYIVEKSSQIPWLIQYICGKALERQRNEKLIRRIAIDEILQSDAFFGVLTRSILDDQSLEPIHFLVVYVFLSIGEECCQDYDLTTAIEKVAKHIPLIEIERALRHLTETYVFRKTLVGGYRFFVDEQRIALSRESHEDKIRRYVSDISRAKERRFS